MWFEYLADLPLSISFPILMSKSGIFELDYVLVWPFARERSLTPFERGMVERCHQSGFFEFWVVVRSELEFAIWWFA